MSGHDHKCQQFELYAAEGGVGQGREFKTEAEMQSWLDGLRDLPFWTRFYPQVLRVEVRFGRGPGSVGGYDKADQSGLMEMGPSHRNELVGLHELAHVLADARYGSRAHCPWFARVYLELVYFVMGREAWDALHASFDDADVKHDIEREPFEWGTHREMGPAS